MTGTTNSTGFRSFTTGATALAAYVRVKVSSGLLVVAGATDAAIGVTIHAAAIGAPCTVKLFNAPGTFACIAAAAITAGNAVYPAASGKVTATGTTALNYIALEAATADGDVIELARTETGA